MQLLHLFLKFLHFIRHFSAEHSKQQVTIALGKVVDNIVIVEQSVPVNIEKSKSPLRLSDMVERR